MKTHGMQTNLTAAWMSEFREEIDGCIAAGLNNLGVEDEDGYADVHYIMYRLLPGADQEHQDPGQEYIQAAGHPHRMTVEIRREEPDGYRQYVIGRPEAATETDTTETIDYADTPLNVRPSEVLTATEAIPIFLHYYDHHSIPTPWHLRERQHWPHPETPIQSTLNWD
ncbi:MAG: hypothetical protein ACRCSF_07015 [Mycobacteriaceae bacterium]